jgi:hypothetical protein
MIMTFNRALQILSKFFSVDTDVFQKGISRQNIIAWAEQIKDGEVKNEDGKIVPPGNYRLTRDQHAFLTGEILSY